MRPMFVFNSPEINTRNILRKREKIFFSVFVFILLNKYNEWKQDRMRNGEKMKTVKRKWKKCNKWYFEPECSLATQQHSVVTLCKFYEAFYNKRTFTNVHIIFRDEDSQNASIKCWHNKNEEKCVGPKWGHINWRETRWEKSGRQNCFVTK